MQGVGILVSRVWLAMYCVLVAATSVAAQDSPQAISYGESTSAYGVSTDFALDGSARDVVHIVASSAVGYLCVDVIDDSGRVTNAIGCSMRSQSTIELPRSGRFIIRVASINPNYPQPFSLTVLKLFPAHASPILNPYPKPVSATSRFAAGNADALYFAGVQGTAVRIHTRRDVRGAAAHVCFSLFDPLGHVVTGACAAWGDGVQTTVSLPLSGLYAVLIYEYSWTLPQQFDAVISCEANCSALPQPLEIVGRSPLSTVTLGQLLVDEGGLLPVGGSVPYGEWGIAGGDLPPGLTLDPIDGRIRGVPSENGTWYFDASLVDAAGVTTTQPFILRVAEETTRFKVMSSRYSAFFKNDALICRGGRGFTIVVIDVVSGATEACKSFDTWQSDPNLVSFSAYVRSIAEDGSKLVLIATGDENGLYRNTSAGALVKTTLETAFGARQVRGLAFRGSYTLLAIAGEQIPLREASGAYTTYGGWATVERSFTFATTPAGGIE